jgi:hypothetical protein
LRRYGTTVKCRPSTSCMDGHANYDAYCDGDRSVSTGAFADGTRMRQHEGWRICSGFWHGSSVERLMGDGGLIRTPSRVLESSHRGAKMLGLLLLFHILDRSSQRRSSGRWPVNVTNDILVLAVAAPFAPVGRRPTMWALGAIPTTPLLAARHRLLVCGAHVHYPPKYGRREMVAERCAMRAIVLGPKAAMLRITCYVRVKALGET